MNLFVGAVVDNFNRQADMGEQEEGLEADMGQGSGGPGLGGSSFGGKAGGPSDVGTMMSGLQEPTEEERRARAARGYYLIEGCGDPGAAQERRARGAWHKTDQFTKSGTKQHTDGSEAARNSARGWTLQSKRCDSLIHRGWVQMAAGNARKQE